MVPLGVGGRGSRVLRSVQRLVFLLWAGWVFYWVLYRPWKEANYMYSSRVPQEERVLRYLSKSPNYKMERLLRSPDFHELTEYEQEELMMLADPNLKLLEHEDRYRILVEAKRRVRDGGPPFVPWKPPTFWDCFRSSLKQSWQKSNPHGLEFVAGLLAPLVVSYGGLLVFRWSLPVLKWPRQSASGFLREFSFLAPVGFGLWLLLTALGELRSTGVLLGLLACVVVLPVGAVLARRWWDEYVYAVTEERVLEILEKYKLL